MGGWRDRYRAFAEDAKPEPGIGLSGQPFAFHYGLPVDSAGALTDGRAFKDIREFKQLLLDHEERTVARNLVSQLATYATGAPVGFSDRKQVEEILDKTRGSGYGVRDIVHGIVAERSLPEQMTGRSHHVEITDSTIAPISRRTMLRGVGVGAGAAASERDGSRHGPRAVRRRAAPHVRHLQQPRPAAR